MCMNVYFACKHTGCIHECMFARMLYVYIYIHMHVNSVCIYE